MAKRSFCARCEGGGSTNPLANLTLQTDGALRPRLKLHASPGPVVGVGCRTSALALDGVARTSVILHLSLFRLFSKSPGSRPTQFRSPVMQFSDKEGVV